MEKLLKGIGYFIIFAGVAAVFALGKPSIDIFIYIGFASIVSASIFLGIGTIIELQKKQIYLLSKLVYEGKDITKELTESNSKSEDDNDEEESDNKTVIMVLVGVAFAIVCFYIVFSSMH